MKKLIFMLACSALTLVACDGLGGGSKKLQAENDSLMSELLNRNSELDEMMGTFNQISEGFRQISAAENRVDLERGKVGEGASSAREQIARDIEFIQKQMQENKEQIAKLNNMLKKSGNQNAEMKKAVAQLSAQLEQKARQIADLQSELAAKNIRIQELDEAVSQLTTVTEDLQAENKAKAETVAQQDRALNKAWFVFGTRRELKEQNIITGDGLFSKGKVLESDNANKDYFTECDIRTQKDIKLYSKSAELLTSHPEGSHTLEKDSKGELTLHISKPADFWSASKYLVIQVK